MRIIKKFNEINNESYNSDERYEMWRVYREKITDIITCINLTNKKILIIGAGNLNDINLKEIIKKTKNITLLDIDENSIRSGLTRQKLDQKLCSIIEADLTGFDTTDFLDEYKKALINNKLSEFLKSYHNYKLDYNFGKYDVVIILPIYTQILFHQMMYIANNFLDVVTNEISMEIMNFVAVMLSTINTKIIEALNINGEILSFSDTIEYQNGSEDHKKIQQLIKNNEEINIYYGNYINDVGHTLGTYGLYDLETKLELINKHFLIWNFDNNRNMLVRGINLKLKSKF